MLCTETHIFFSSQRYCVSILSLIERHRDSRFALVRPRSNVISHSCHGIEGGEVNFLHVPQWWQSFSNRDKTSVLRLPGYAWLRAHGACHCTCSGCSSRTVIARGREGGTSVSLRATNTWGEAKDGDDASECAAVVMQCERVLSLFAPIVPCEIARWAERGLKWHGNLQQKAFYTDNMQPTTSECTLIRMRMPAFGSTATSGYELPIYMHIYMYRWHFIRRDWVTYLFFCLLVKSVIVIWYALVTLLRADAHLRSVHWESWRKAVTTFFLSSVRTDYHIVLSFYRPGSLGLSRESSLKAALNYDLVTSFDRRCSDNIEAIILSTFFYVFQHVTSDLLFVSEL